MNLSLGVYDPMNTNRARREYKLGNRENVDGRERCGYCGPFSELECIYFFSLSVLVLRIEAKILVGEAVKSSGLDH